MKPVKKPNYINFKVLQFIFKQWSKIATSFFQDQFFEIIENSQVHFIHCILPAKFILYTAFYQNRWMDW